MHFTSLAAGTIAVLASVHGAAAQATPTTTASPTVSLSPAQSSAAACLNACDVKDVTCRSHCIAVPSPDMDQANKTNKCVGQCPQGDGTAAENEKYKECVETCITDNYYVTSTGTPSPTDAAGSDSGSDDGSSDDSDDSDGTESGTGSDSGNTSTSVDSSATDTNSPPTSTSDATSSTESDAAAQETDQPDAARALAGSSVTVFGVLAALFVL